MMETQRVSELTWLSPERIILSVCLRERFKSFIFISHHNISLYFLNHSEMLANRWLTDIKHFLKLKWNAIFWSYFGTEWLSLFLRVPSSNLGSEAGCPDSDFLLFSSVPPGSSRDTTLTSNSFINYFAIRIFTLWATGRKFSGGSDDVRVSLDLTSHVGLLARTQWMISPCACVINNSESSEFVLLSSLRGFNFSDLFSKAERSNI